MMAIKDSWPNHWNIFKGRQSGRRTRSYFQGPSKIPSTSIARVGELAPEKINQAFENDTLVFAYELSRASQKDQAPRDLKSTRHHIEVVDNSLPQTHEAIAKNLKAPAQERERTLESPRYNSYFMRAKEHDWLYRLGTSFKEDTARGQKVFGLVDYLGEDSAHFMLGLGSWYGHEEHCNVLIVADDELAGKLYAILLAESDPKKQDHVSTFDNIHVMRLDEYLDLSKKGEIKMFLESYSFALVQVPTPEVTSKRYQYYHPMMATIHSLSVLIRSKKISYRKLSKLRSYFKNFGMTFKGVFLGGQV